MDSKFIDKQIERIVKVINEINTIVTMENLKPRGRKYKISFQNCTGADYFSLRIHTLEDRGVGFTDKIEYWCVSGILNKLWPDYTKKEITDEALLKLIEMKDLAYKYVELNNENEK